MDMHDRIKRLGEIGDRYVQQVANSANEAMGIVRRAYFETIKLLLGLSFAALPLLATVFGLAGHKIDPQSKQILIWAVSIFLVSIILGLIALLTTAYTFRKNAHRHGDELRKFLGKCEGNDPDVIEGYFKEGRQKIIKEGIFEKLQLGWFIGQIVAFLVGLLRFA